MSTNAGNAATQLVKKKHVSTFSFKTQPVCQRFLSGQCEAKFKDHQKAGLGGNLLTVLLCDGPSFLGLNFNIHKLKSVRLVPKYWSLDYRPIDCIKDLFLLLLIQILGICGPRPPESESGAEVGSRNPSAFGLGAIGLDHLQV